MNTFNGCAYNYTGNKAKLMPSLYEILPKQENLTCLDLFNGGNSLGSQLPSYWEVTANDKEVRLVEVHQAFSDELKLRTPEELVAFIKTYCHSYVDKSKNPMGYKKLVEDYNEDKTPLRLYALLCSSFSNQLRWNSSGNWNLPWGNRYFNSSMEKKLLQYFRNLQKGNINFTSKDFREFEFSDYDVVISDSPYLKSNAHYNESGGWSFSDSVSLLSRLDKYADTGGKFFVFEELWSNGKPNQLLIDWSTKYNIKQLGDNSDKCNYQRRGGKTQEVIIFS